MAEVRLIDANVLIESFEYLAEKSFFEDTRIHYALAIETVKAQPTIKPEVRHGRWVKIEPNGSQFRRKCSDCEGIVHTVSDFCPYCGARMKGVADNANT